MKDTKLRRAFIVLFIIIVALALRLYGVDRYTFWSDEASLLLDTRSVSDITPLTAYLDPSFSRTNQDYLLMYNHLFIHYWRKVFGSSEFGLRFSSVVFSLVSLWLMYIVGKHFFSRESVFIALVLMCLSPMHIYYAQELRPYAALGCFFLLAVLSVVKIVFHNKEQYWFLYVLVIVVSVYFHFIMVLPLCFFMLYFIANSRGNHTLVKRVVCAHTGIVIMLMPVWIIIAHNYYNFLRYTVHLELNEYPVWGGTISLIHLFCTLKNFSIGYAVSYTSWIGILQSVLFLTLFTAGVWASFANVKVRFLLFCILFPVASLFLLSLIKPCYVDRYVYYVLLLVLLCVASGLVRCRKRVSLVALTVIVAMNGYGLFRYYTNNYPDDTLTSLYGITKKQNIRHIAQFLGHYYKAGDAIMHTWKGTVFPLKFYARQYSTNNAFLREVDKGGVLFSNEETSTMIYITYDTIHPHVVVEESNEKVDLSSIQRLWLFYAKRGYDVITMVRQKGFAIKHVIPCDDGALYLLSK